MNSEFLSSICYCSCILYGTICCLMFRLSEIYLLFLVRVDWDCFLEHRVLMGLVWKEFLTWHPSPLTRIQYLVSLDFFPYPLPPAAPINSSTSMSSNRNLLSLDKSLQKKSMIHAHLTSLTVIIFVSCTWIYYILNTLGDKSAQVPGGIRIGSPAMTTRGFTEKEFIATADFIHEGVKIALEAKRSVSGSKLQDFMKFIGSPDFALMDLVSELRMRVEALTTQFPLPGLWERCWIAQISLEGDIRRSVMVACLWN